MTTPQITDRRRKVQENFHNSVEIDGIREEISAGGLLVIGIAMSSVQVFVLPQCKFLSGSWGASR
jgi:hypothetical protein